MPPAAPASAAETPGPARKSFNVRRVRNREAPPVSMLRTSGSQPHHQDLLSPPATADPRPQRGAPLGRSTSVNSADVRRRSIGGRPPTMEGPHIQYHEAHLTSASDRSSMDGRRLRTTESAATQPGEASSQTAVHGASLTATTASATTTTARARSLGHMRRNSIQARRARRDEAREAALPEETSADQDIVASGGSGDISPKAATAGGGDEERAAENVRPVYLKGLFSVATTSPKPVSAIRAEIIRVLRQLGVEHTEIRGGFRCRHRPSIDLGRVQDHHHHHHHHQHQHQHQQDAAAPPDRGRNAFFGNRRRISFGGLRGAADRDEFRERARSPTTTTTTTTTTAAPPLPRTSSRRRPRHDASPTFSEGSDASVGRGGAGGGAAALAAAATTNTASEATANNMHSELRGGGMVLQFEIIIVKVPILALHGLQFKRMSGGTWQYKSMAEQILKELRL
jgi:hypothetical protein